MTPVLQAESVAKVYGSGQASVRAVDDGRLVAKISTYAPIRHQAVLTLDRVLAGTQVGPGSTNMAELRQVLGNESFRAGQYDTTFIPRHVGQ